MTTAAPRLGGHLPLAISMAGALTGTLIGLTLSETSTASDSLWAAPFWIPALIGMVLGLVTALAFSPYLRISMLMPVQKALASSAVRVVAFTAAFGLAMGIIGVIACVAIGVWQLKWFVVWISIATAPLYGGLAGLGALFSNGPSAR